MVAGPGKPCGSDPGTCGAEAVYRPSTEEDSQWVQCHRPMSLDLAIQLVEDQMVACPGVSKSLPAPESAAQWAGLLPLRGPGAVL